MNVEVHRLHAVALMLHLCFCRSLPQTENGEHFFIAKPSLKPRFQVSLLKARLFVNRNVLRVTTFEDAINVNEDFV